MNIRMDSSKNPTRYQKLKQIVPILSRASSAPARVLFVLWGTLFAFSPIMAQEPPPSEEPPSEEPPVEELPSDFPDDIVLETIIDDISELVQGYTVQFFLGNQLFLPQQSLSEPLFIAQELSIAERLPVSNTQVLRNVYISQERIDLSPEFLLNDEGALLLQQVDAVLPSLPSSLEHEGSALFDFFTAGVYLLYSYTPPNMILHSARVEIHGLERGSTGKRPSTPGSPLLVWPQEEPEKTAESRILLRLMFDNAQNLSQILRYRYDYLGNFYELQQTSANAGRHFLALDDAGDGSRELIVDKDFSLISIRSFDDQGRLLYTSASNSSESEANTRIQYLDNGDKEELESLGTGETEQRRYDEENKLLSTLRTFPNGREESRNFTYTTEGEILTEEYQGTLGSARTEYRYDGGELTEVQSTENGLPSRLLEIDIDNDTSLETRFLRGEPVLRIYFENDRRILEEEIFKGDVIRQREYQ